MVSMRSTPRPTAIPIMAPCLRPFWPDWLLTALDWTPGEVILTGMVENTVPSRPIIVPAGGCCRQPAWRATRTVDSKY